ncbi:unnamed protein product [Rotaria sordida]|uniref:Uncharacterized protein n=1 Tax=Rotaria sordida TaxID=392033 RepID=A0A818SDW8_9BILA|nr:unnamed protein product [Rotaria sordida]CAF3668123.1 unnamed protein product [Rotaria sordida]
MKHRGSLINFWGQQMKLSTSPSTTSAISDFATASSSSPSSSTYQQLEDRTDPHEVSPGPVSSQTVLTSFDASTEITTPFITPAQYQRTIELNSMLTISFASADDRRRTEILCSVKTLDDLCIELPKSSLYLSRSAAYLRLLPKSSNTSED